jgi:hypothetical protein
VTITMKWLGLIAVAAASCVRSSTAQKVHPIQKVINLIQALAEKAKIEGTSEAATYEQYTHWCEKTSDKLKKAIEDEKSSISITKNKVEAKQQENKTLSKQIKALDAEIAQIQATAGKNAADRASAVALYNATKKDFDDTINALDQALRSFANASNVTKKLKPVALQAEADSSEEEKFGALQLLRLPLFLSKLNDAEQDILMQMSASPLTGAPKTQNYDSKTGVVVDLLKKIKIDFLDQRAKAERENMEADFAYQKIKATTDEQLAAANAAKDTKTLNKAQLVQTLLTDIASLTSTQKDMQADAKTLEDTTLSCKIKADEFKQRVHLRKQEQEALAYGIQILQQVSGVRTAPPSKAASFLQVRTTEHEAWLKVLQSKRDAISLLLLDAKKFNSKGLESLYRKVSHHLNQVPAQVQQQVNLTITKQIWALRDEQLAEDKKKNWCDLELNKTNGAIASKAEELNRLGDSTTKGQSTAILLQKDIEAAQKAIEDIQNSNHEATMVRQKEQNENQKTIKDAQDAQQAIKDAIAALQKFYQEAGKSTALLETPTVVAQAPATWSSVSYKGNSASETVISVLQQTSADFARLEVDTNAQESSQQSRFEADRRDAQIEIDRRKLDIETKTEQVKDLTQKIADWQKTSELTDRARLLLIQDAKDLNKQCNISSYEARKQARLDEIKTLKGARVSIAKAFSGNSSTVKPANATARNASIANATQQNFASVNRSLTKLRRWKSQSEASSLLEVGQKRPSTKGFLSKNRYLSLLFGDE